MGSACAEAEAGVADAFVEAVWWDIRDEGTRRAIAEAVGAAVPRAVGAADEGDRAGSKSDNGRAGVDLGGFQSFGLHRYRSVR